MYGLKQEPREWNHTLTKGLLSYRLKESKNDQVLLVYKPSSKVHVALVVHVDGIILAGVKTFVEDFKTKLQA